MDKNIAFGIVINDSDWSHLNTIDKDFLDQNQVDTLFHIDGTYSD